MAKALDVTDYLNDLQLTFPAAAYSTRRAHLSGTASGALLYPQPQGAPILQTPLLIEGREQAFIADKSLISFAPEVSGHNRADILESTLLAQLGAKSKVKDDTDTVGWFNAYIDILSKIGWSVEGGEIRNISTSANAVEFQNVIVNILNGAFDSSFMAAATKALDAIKNIGGVNGRIDAFEKNTHTENSGSFQIAVAKQEAGAVSINLGTFLITSTNQIKQILFIKFSKDDTALQYASSKLTLDPIVYSSIRQLIQKKLSGKAAEFVAEILL